MCINQKFRTKVINGTATTTTYVLGHDEQLADDVVGEAAPHEPGEVVIAQGEERGEHDLQRRQRAHLEEARLHHVAPELVRRQAHHVRRDALGDGHLETLAATLDDSLQEIVAACAPQRTHGFFWLVAFT
jgi:hypothetical protein